MNYLMKWESMVLDGSQDSTCAVEFSVMGRWAGLPAGGDTLRGS